MKLAIAGLIVGSFGLAICIYSTAIDHWCLLSNQKEMFYFGLWRQCMSWVVVQKCKSWSMLKSCELFSILTHSPIHHSETIPNSNKLQTTTEM